MRRQSRGAFLDILVQQPSAILVHPSTWEIKILQFSCTKAKCGLVEYSCPITPVLVAFEITTDYGMNLDEVRPIRDTCCRYCDPSWRLYPGDEQKVLAGRCVRVV